VLHAALASHQTGRSWAVAFALDRLHAPADLLLPVLLETIGVDDGDLRWAAATIVVGLAERGQVLEKLRGLLPSGNAAQRKMALYCLRDLGVRAAEVDSAVVRCLADEDPDVQLAAVATLARPATDRAAAAAHLLRALDAIDPGLRRAAAAGLGALGEYSPPVLAALEHARSSADASLARAAAGALRQLGRGSP